MFKTIASLALSLAALVPAPGMKEIVKEPLADETTLYIQVMPHRVTPADGDYVVEGNTTDAAQRYEALKAALDERFAYMFELKETLEKQQSEMSKGWEEYYALHDKYNRELKRIVALWATEASYLDKETPAPRIPAPPAGRAHRPHKPEPMPLIEK